MKLVTLNLWGGIVYDELVNFIKEKSTDIDIFCFQEVLYGNEATYTEVNKARANLYNEIELVLPDFIGFKNITEGRHFQNEPVNFPTGQAIFVKKEIAVSDNGFLKCYDGIAEDMSEGGKMTGNLNWVRSDLQNGSVTILNLHGLWLSGTRKKDTPLRIIQSQKIIDFLNNTTGKKILCGDFNLLPDGKSMEILEQGMINLVKKFNITSTRSSYYKKSSVPFADYILVSPDVKIIDFKVLTNEVSDHLPLYLEFE